MPKILIIRFSSIGDIVLTTPVVRCLKQQVKNAEIHFITKKSFADILNNNPHVDKVYSIDKDISEVVNDLKKEKYNEIIDLHNNLRSSLLKRKLKVKSHTFNKLNIQKWLLVNFKINNLPEVHIVDRCMKTVAHLGVINDNKGLDYFIPEKDKVAMESVPFKEYNAFVIGAKHYTKQLPKEKIISIIKNLKSSVVLLGGKEDFEKGEFIKKEIGENVFNACGKFNLNQSASILQQSKLVISHDTGLMHIASALKKQVISVWGSTVPGFGMYPYMPGISSEKLEVKNLNCRPCSKIGYEKCPLGHFKCMNNIDETRIAEIVNG